MDNPEMTIDPVRDFPDLLMSVENPGRYVGGEFGSVTEGEESDYRVALCFPDLYEIGMSNNAIRILYTLLNALSGVRCERVFAPAPDFEAILIDRAIPLYGLELGTPLYDFDLIAFSVGYELAATSILTVLDRGGVPLERWKRHAGDPIVIAGGPAVTNPLPLSDFVDAFYIGEAEGELPGLIRQLADHRIRKAGRDDGLSVLAEHRSVYVPNARQKPKTVHRGVWGEFGTQSSLPATPIVPNIRVVQDHGVVEIMRGCPNGCRFCHAGVYYRPYRMKTPDLIANEVHALVHGAGYRHITLSSLSSADYSEVGGLIRILNRSFRDHRVSFALPSLRVNSVSLSILEEIASVRKSGLTFAVETPLDADQIGLNKSVNRDNLIVVLKEARERGWRVAKFYFMIGLPGVDWDDQADAIVEYMEAVRAEVRINVNVNVATFVPKPHTPYQWAPQLSEDRALADLAYLKRRLKKIGVKLSYASPFHSLLEGVISRGDERVGQIIAGAYHAGTRLDAWDEYTNRDVWNRALDAADWPVRELATAARPVDEPLPWEFVSLGPSKTYLAKEYRRSTEPALTEYCASECAHHCGVCNSRHPVRDLTKHTSQYRTPAVDRTSLATGSAKPSTSPPGDRVSGAQEAEGGAPPKATGSELAHRIVFSFTRRRTARFVPHLSTMSVFERSLQRAGISVSYTEGFNPKPRLEFAQPLSLGIASECEIAAVDVQEFIDTQTFRALLDRALPPDFSVTEASAVTWDRGSKKPTSLMSQYWGSRYRIQVPDDRGISLGGLEARLSSCDGVHDLQLEEGSLILSLESDGGRIPGIKALLTRILGENPVSYGLTVTRVAMYAKDDHGRPVRYSAFPS